MAESGRLYVTPDEFFGRARNNGSHPHGAEGECGGREGHGTPELERQARQARRDTEHSPVDRDGARGERSQKPDNVARERRSDVPVKKTPEDKAALLRADSSAVGDGVALTSRENAALGMKMAVILSEPLCRRYGMPAYMRNKRF